VAYPIRLSGRGWCASSVGGGVSAVLGGVSVLATFIYIYTLNFGDDRLENNVTNLNAAFGKVTLHHVDILVLVRNHVSLSSLALPEHIEMASCWNTRSYGAFSV
jgi:hypothetical protein